MDTSEVADRLHIADLLHTYVHGVDARDFDLVASCFTADAVLDYSASGGPRAGLDESIAWLKQGLDSLPFTQHYVTNQRVTVDGDTATSDAYFFHPMDLPNGGETVLLGGRYHDRLRRTGDGWRITERVQDVTWTRGIEGATIGVRTQGA